MAEFTFPCPACHKHIQCDDAWTGQQINCPLCQALFTVPKNASAQHNPLVPKPPGESKLATAMSTKVARSSFGAGAPAIREFNKGPKKGKSKAIVTYAVSGLVVVALGVGGYVWGWPAFQKWKEGRESAENAPAAGSEQAASTDPAADPATAAPPPEPAITDLPIVSPVYTLDVEKAEIPKTRLNGSISGTNFVAEAARLTRVGATSVLELRQGTGLSPDRGVQVVLKVGPNEVLTNRTFNVTSTEKPTVINSVTKLWKPNPKYAAQQKKFFNGYAMKLEFGSQAEDGSIPGKIFLALPDPEKSVMAGLFTIASATPNPQGYEATPVQQATPQDTEQQRRFQQRYGIRR